MVDNGEEHYEYRLICEVWNGEWFSYPSGPQSYKAVKEQIAKLDRPRPSSPNLGDAGRAYYQKRKVGKWEGRPNG